MVKFIASGQKHPCPICGRGEPGNPRQDGDCRISLDEGLVLCHTEVNHREKGEELNGHIYIGEDEGGLWGRWRAKTADFVKERPVGQQFRYPFTDRSGRVVVEEVRVYKANGKDSWMEPAGVDTGTLLPYRYAEAIAALQAGAPHCFIVEGPPKSDALWEIGFPAVTFAIGFKPSRDSHWFEGYEDRLVIVPDQDKPGMEKAAKVALAYPMAKSFRPWPNSARWLPEWIPEKGGADVRDWVDELRRRGVGDEEIQGMILAGIEDRRPASPVVAAQISPAAPTTTGAPAGKDDRGKPSDEDAEIDREEITLEVNQLLEHCRQEFDIAELIHPALATQIKEVARLLNVAPEAYLQVLLPVAASLLKTDSSVEISRSTGHYARPILWNGLVAPSGSVKSPIFRHITEPLSDLEQLMYERWQEDHRDWELQHQTWERSDKATRGAEPVEPKERQLYFQDATIEGIASELVNHPSKGAVLAVDELGGFFNGMNQYKSGGKGNDRQRWLSSYDGGALKSTRKTTKGVKIHKTSLSMVGTIQPEILQKIMGNLNEVDGLWARFLWVQLPASELPPPDESRPYILGTTLSRLYSDLESLEPVKVGMSADAKIIWREWHILTERAKMAESHPTLRSLYPKIREQAARVALVAHAINSLYSSGVEPLISIETVNAAIEWAKYCLGQAKIIYASFGVCDNPQSAKVLKFVERFKNSGWINTVKAAKSFTASHRPSAEKTREFMTLVVSLGYAIDNGEEGSRFQIKILGSEGICGSNAYTTSNPQGQNQGQGRDKVGSKTNSPSAPNPSNKSLTLNVGSNVPNFDPRQNTSNPISSNGLQNLDPDDPDSLDKNSQVSSGQHPANLNGQANGAPSAKVQIQVGELRKINKSLGRVLTDGLVRVTKLKLEANKADVRGEKWHDAIPDQEVDIDDLELI